MVIFNMKSSDQLLAEIVKAYKGLLLLQTTILMQQVDGLMNLKINFTLMRSMEEHIRIILEFMISVLIHGH